MSMMKRCCGNLYIQDGKKRGLTRFWHPVVKKMMMNTAWTMERRVVHNRRTWIREFWLGCDIVSLTAELRAA